METYFKVAFSSLGAIDSPSKTPAGMSSKATTNSDLESAGASLIGTTWPLPSGYEELEEPVKKKEMMKKTTSASTIVTERCCRRAIVGNPQQEHVRGAIEGLDYEQREGGSAEKGSISQDPAIDASRGGDGATRNNRIGNGMGPWGLWGEATGSVLHGEENQAPIGKGA